MHAARANLRLRTGVHRRLRQRLLRRRAAWRDRRGREPGADRESPIRGDRRHRALPHRKPAAGPLHRDLHASRLQHRQARRDRADRLVRGNGERRASRRHARRNHHGHRRDADCRCAEHGASARAPQAGARRAAGRAHDGGAGRTHPRRDREQSGRRRPAG